MSTGPFAEAMRRQFDFDGDPGEHFMADLVACADLTGDGEDEMVIQGFGPTGGGPVPWGILTPAEGRWELALARFTIVVRSLEIIDGTVQEVSAAYAVEDPLCCPSSERSGSLSWDGDSFGYAPDNGSPDRRIEVTSDGRPAQLGELDLRTGDLLTARALFGPPSSVSSDSLTECRAAWSDLGLRINFQDFSGNGACGAGGNVGSVEIEAGPGEQAGWALADGLGVGTSIEAVLNEYPDARHEDQDLEEECSGTPYVLRTMSFAGEVASVLVHAGQGEVECLRLNVFAAGD